MKRKQIDPRIANEVAARKHKALIDKANSIYIGKHNGSKKHSTLLGLVHRYNDRITNFYTHYVSKH